MSTPPPPPSPSHYQIQPEVEEGEGGGGSVLTILTGKIGQVEPPHPPTPRNQTLPSTQALDLFDQNDPLPPRTCAGQVSSQTRM